MTEEPDRGEDARHPPSVAVGRRDGQGRFLSPAVRSRIAAGEADPDGMTGTGPGGRVTVRDLDRDHRSSDTAADPALPGPATGDRGDAERSAVTAVPFTSIRRRTAAHMVESLAASAHTLVVMEIDYEPIARVRARHRSTFAERHGTSLTFLAFIAHAVTRALAEFPRINARVGDDELLIQPEINLGIAVDLDHEGLVVPVVRHADRLGLAGLAMAIADQATGARERALTPDDVTGGTFTITNAGGHGTLITAPVINQPQVAILSTDGVAVRPVAVAQPDGGYALGFHHVGNLCLSFDHRAFDGAYASEFLARLRELLQDTDWEQLL